MLDGWALSEQPGSSAAAPHQYAPQRIIIVRTEHKAPHSCQITEELIRGERRCPKFGDTNASGDLRVGGLGSGDPLGEIANTKPNPHCVVPCFVGVGGIITMRVGGFRLQSPPRH